MISDHSARLNCYNFPTSPVHIAVSRNNCELLDLLLSAKFLCVPIGSLQLHPVHVAAENSFLDLL